VGTNHRIVNRREEEASDRPKSSFSEDEKKSSKVSTTTLDTKHQENSKMHSEKEFIEKEDPSKISEIDLSYASQRTELGGNKEKTKVDRGREVISIQSPTEAIFEAEAKPIEKVPSKGDSKTTAVGERKSSPFRTKPEKASKADLGAEKKPKGKRTPKKSKPRISRPIPEQVVMSKGVAYLDGNTIRMTGGIKPHPGEQIKIGEREFVLKVREKKRKPLYLLFFILLVITVLTSFQLLKGKGSGRLIGIVLEEKNKILLSGAEIQIKELGKKVNTNQLGFFMFDVVPSGSYTLQTRLKGYQAVEDNITITKKQTTTITVSLSSTHLTGFSDSSSAGVVSGIQDSKEAKTQSKYGAIRIESNVSDPVVVVDDWSLGKGNEVYNNIYIGKHTVKISQEGFQDWTQKVEIKPEETLTLKANLTAAESDALVPQSSEDWIALAQTQTSSNDFSGAVNSYGQALTLDPNSAEALLGRGLVYVQLSDRPKALEDMSKAAKHYAQEKNCDKAIICYTNLLALNDKDLESFYNRGLCYLKLGRYQKSVSDLEKTVELDQEFFSGYLYLGEACYKSGNYEASIKNYKKAKNLNAHSQQVYVGLAKAYFASGEKSSAQKSYKKFKELSTYIDRERMKQDPEWRELLEGIGEKAEPEF
jgi:tetratricopeptide (TPR) repeat protein